MRASNLITLDPENETASDDTKDPNTVQRQRRREISKAAEQRAAHELKCFRSQQSPWYWAHKQELD